MRPNRPSMTLRALSGLLLIGLTAASVPAQDEEAEKKAAIEPEVLVTNLLNPCGLVIHGETGHVFIANRHGVYRYLPDEKAKLDELTAKLEELEGKDEPTDEDKQAISKLQADIKAKSAEVVVIEIHSPKKDVYGKGPKYDIGPLGLAFLDNERLVVGDGSRPDGDELVRVYKVAATPPEMPAKKDSAVQTLGPITAKENVTAKGEGNFYGVAIGGGAIFVTCNGDDTKGWISKCTITDGKPGELLPTIATKEATGVDAPVPVTFSPDGKELVVGQMGEVTVPGDSLLTIYDPATGELKKSYKTGLSDLAGLAYNPKNGKLYGTDFAWAEPANGGLYELTIEGDEVKATKVLKLDKPTAIAFDKEGNLYVAEFGTKPEGEATNPGRLSIIAADAGL